MADAAKAAKKSMKPRKGSVSELPPATLPSPAAASNGGPLDLLGDIPPSDIAAPVLMPVSDGAAPPAPPVEPAAPAPAAPAKPLGTTDTASHGSSASLALSDKDSKGKEKLAASATKEKSFGLFSTMRRKKKEKQCVGLPFCSGASPLFRVDVRIPLRCTLWLAAIRTSSHRRRKRWRPQIAPSRTW